MVGSVNVDFVVRAPRLPVEGETVSRARFETFVGGKGGNQAVATARLGVPTSMVAKVGDDNFGERLRRSLRAAGVDVRSVKTAHRVHSGTAFVITEPDGQNQIVVAPGANTTLSVADVERAASQIRSAAMVLAQLEVPPAPVARLAKLAARHGVPLILDPAPARPLPQSLLRRVTVLTPNEAEACVLCACKPGRLDLSFAKRLAGRLLARGPQAVILKLGERGAVLARRNNRPLHLPAFRVKAVDTTAAGDAFNGGLAVALLAGKSLEEATRFACAAGALAVTRPGAQPSIPTRAALNAFLRNRARPNR